MPDFNNFDLSELYDMLGVYTKIYTRMLSLIMPPSEKFLYTKGIVEQLQAEIRSRVADPEIQLDRYIDALNSSSSA